MEFRNEKHKAAFTEAIKKVKPSTKTMASALYLLTADNGLGYMEPYQAERHRIQHDR